MAPEFEHRIPNGRRLWVVDADGPDAVLVPHAEWVALLDLAAKTADDEDRQHYELLRHRMQTPLTESIPLEDLLEELGETPKPQSDE